MSNAPRYFKISDRLQWFIAHANSQDFRQLGKQNVIEIKEAYYGLKNAIAKAEKLKRKYNTTDLFNARNKKFDKDFQAYDLANLLNTIEGRSNYYSIEYNNRLRAHFIINEEEHNYAEIIESIDAELAVLSKENQKLKLSAARKAAKEQAKQKADKYVAQIDSLIARKVKNTLCIALAPYFSKANIEKNGIINSTNEDTLKKLQKTIWYDCCIYVKSKLLEKMAELNTLNKMNSREQLNAYRLATKNIDSLCDEAVKNFITNTKQSTNTIDSSRYPGLSVLSHILVASTSNTKFKFEYTDKLKSAADKLYNDFKLLRNSNNSSYSNEISAAIVITAFNSKFLAEQLDAVYAMLNKCYEILTEATEETTPRTTRNVGIIKTRLIKDFDDYYKIYDDVADYVNRDSVRLMTAANSLTMATKKFFAAQKKEESIQKADYDSPEKIVGTAKNILDLLEKEGFIPSLYDQIAAFKKHDMYKPSLNIDLKHAQFNITKKEPEKNVATLLGELQTGMTTEEQMAQHKKIMQIVEKGKARRAAGEATMPSMLKGYDSLPDAVTAPITPTSSQAPHVSQAQYIESMNKTASKTQDSEQNKKVTYKPVNAYEEDIHSIFYYFVNLLATYTPVDSGNLFYNAFEYDYKPGYFYAYFDMKQAPYAVRQHEETTYNHPYGCAKFMEKAITEAVLLVRSKYDIPVNLTIRGYTETYLSNNIGQKQEGNKTHYTEDVNVAENMIPSSGGPELSVTVGIPTKNNFGAIINKRTSEFNYGGNYFNHTTADNQYFSDFLFNEARSISDQIANIKSELGITSADINNDILNSFIHNDVFDRKYAQSIQGLTPEQAMSAAKEAVAQGNATDAVAGLLLYYRINPRRMNMIHAAQAMINNPFADIDKRQGGVR